MSDLFLAVQPPMDMTDAGLTCKYERIYDTVKMKKMIGFESPFRGSKEPRRLVVDAKKLQLQDELGNCN